MLHFTDQEVTSGFRGKRIIRRWIVNELENRGLELGELNIIFCSDAYILNLNKESLGHDFYTDIITFNYNTGKVISGDLFISLDTVYANSALYEQMFLPASICELCRVMIHGVLHLCGEDDTTPAKQKKMRVAENKALARLLSTFPIEQIKSSYKSCEKIIK